MAIDERKGTGKERRQDRRFARAVPVHVASESAEGLRAESINISSRGLYCKVCRYVHPFSKLRVVLELPFVSRAPEKVECEGVVVRVDPEREVADPHEYRLAVYFLNLDGGVASLIKEFLAENH